MLRRTFLILLAACTLCVTSGCGTFKNLQGKDEYIPTGRPYGGVRYDYESSMEMLADHTGGHGGVLGRSLQLVVAPYLLLVDLPLSAVGDTLTLHIIQAKMQEKESAGAAASQESQPAVK